MRVFRTTSFLLLGLLVLVVASPALAQPEAPTGPPPAIDPTTPEPGEAEAPTAPEGAPPTSAPPSAPVDLSTAAPGVLPSRDGPKLPSGVGKDEAGARSALSRWRIRTERAFASPEYAGRVIDQDPNPGETYRTGQVVTLVIGVTSLPSTEHRPVPSVSATLMDVAIAKLETAGWSAEVRAVPGPDADMGKVMAQCPLPGSLARRGKTPVWLLVCRGGGTAAPAEAPPTAGSQPVSEEAMPDLEDLGPPPTPVVTEEAPVAPATEGSEGMQPLPPPSMPATPRAPRKMHLPRPTLISPSEGQSFPRAYGSTFQWTTIRSAKTYEWELQVQARDGSWSQAATQMVESTRYRPKRMEKGRFRWRVRAVHEESAGEWSPFFRLYMY